VRSVRIQLLPEWGIFPESAAFRRRRFGALEPAVAAVHIATTQPNQSAGDTPKRGHRLRGFLLGVRIYVDYDIRSETSKRDSMSSQRLTIAQDKSGRCWQDCLGLTAMEYRDVVSAVT
jgi:hypothetical protein